MLLALGLHDLKKKVNDIAINLKDISTVIRWYFSANGSFCI